MLILGLNDAQKRYLACLKRNQVIFAIQVCGAFTHIAGCWLVVVKWKWDIQGVAIASLFTNVVMYAASTFYISTIPEFKQGKREITESSPEQESLLNPSTSLRVLNKEGIIEHIKLGAPCVLMVCLEWWAYQVMTLLSG